MQMLKIHRLNKQSIVSIVLSFTVVLNIFGAALSRMYGIPSVFFTAAPLLLLFLCLCSFKHGTLTVDKNIKFVWAINSFVFMAHIIFCGFGSNEIKYYLYYIVFMVTVSLVEEVNWKSIEVTLTGISIFLAVNALTYLPDMLARGVRIYNVANNTVLDKSVYTLVLTLTFICLLVSFFDKQKKLNKTKKILMFTLLVFLGAINLVLIQSKLFILVLVTAVFVLYFFADGSPKRKARTFVLIFLFGIVLWFVFFPQYIPDYIYVFLNRYLGLFSDNVSGIQAYDRYTTTYGMRSTIYSYALNLFLDHFLFGLGFGNYRIYAMENAILLGGVTQTESSMMNILVEGGLIYFLNHIIFLMILLFRILRMRRKERGNMLFIKFLIILIAYFILNAGNDFFNVLYWVVLGFIYKCSDQKVRCLNENL